MISATDRRAALLAALEWQVALGADEAICEQPIDRAEAPPLAAPATAASPSAARQRPARATPLSSEAAQKAAEENAATDARRLAAQADSIEALRAALLAFEGSPLKKHAANTVFADGNPRARLMVVGEAPGRDEDRQGLPFVGRSGQLLDRMLAAIGLSRRAEEPEKAVYISNVIPYRPLQNRTPDDQEVALLLPFIERHIALVKPAALLCVGNIPAKHLMGAETGITKFRGQWREFSRDGVTVPALASFHPAYLLRSPENKGMAWRDLLSLAEKLESLE